jgi:hypothetical protein
LRRQGREQWAAKFGTEARAQKAQKDANVEPRLEHGEENVVVAISLALFTDRYTAASA